MHLKLNNGIVYNESFQKLDTKLFLLFQKLINDFKVIDFEMLHFVNIIRTKA